jgi:hypothetical protein
MNPSTYVHRKAAPWLLIWAAIIMAMLASCSEPEPEPRIAFTPWEWAECLPSASGYNCTGDKPLWQLYNETGKIVWRYEVSGRTLQTDSEGHVWRIYEEVYCINYAGERVGFHRNLGFRAFQFMTDPITGELPFVDDWGVIEGSLCIFGKIENGKVSPVIW